ncbi:hypothetical protein Dimus_001285 [Dionaea muscipula]
MCSGWCVGGVDTAGGQVCLIGKSPVRSGRVSCALLVTTWLLDYVNMIPSNIYLVIPSTQGKPVQPEELNRNDDIMNDQIKAELAVFAEEVTLADAKRIKA